MERYLLFDSGCNSCTKIADEVEQATAGWLTAQSLRDPAIQRILNDVQCCWKLLMESPGFLLALV